MAAVVGVHGIAQQRKGPAKLASEWGPSMRDGVTLAGGVLGPDDLVCAFYGDVYRPSGEVRAGADPAWVAADVEPDEAELLLALWAGAAEAEPRKVVSPDATDQRLATPRSVQAALNALSRSSFFANLAERAMIGDLKQVRRYLREDDVRDRAIAAVDAAVTADTRVVVAHSLGSVVAWEALHLHAGDDNWRNVTTLVTLGSPLGIANLIFDKLRPPPVDGRGVRPPGITSWTNVADDGDVVALVKRLAPLFGDDVVDIRVDNGATAHDVSPYLTDARTGKAIRDGLA